MSMKIFRKDGWVTIREGNRTTSITAKHFDELMKRLSLSSCETITDPLGTTIDLYRDGDGHLHFRNCRIKP